MSQEGTGAARAVEDARGLPRTISPAGLTEAGPYRLKTYTIAYEAPTRPVLVEAAKQAARTAVGELPGDVRTSGLGFLVIHDGRDGNMVVLGLWSNENELVLATWTSTNEEPQGLKGVAGLRPRACVWDLHVVSFEARTWLQSVLRGQGARKREAYLDAWFQGPV